VRCFCHRSAKTVDPGVWCGQTDDLIVWNLWRIRIARTSIKSFWNYEWSATDKGSASNGPTTYYSAGRPCKPLQVVTVFTGWPFPCSVLVTWSEKKAARKPWAPDDNTVMSMLAMVPVDRSVHLSLLDRQCVHGSYIWENSESWLWTLIQFTGFASFFLWRWALYVEMTLSERNLERTNRPERASVSVSKRVALSH
jgi:hypothetical protein